MSQLQQAELKVALAAVTLPVAEFVGARLLIAAVTVPFMLAGPPGLVAFVMLCAIVTESSSTNPLASLVVQLANLVLLQAGYI